MSASAGKRTRADCVTGEHATIKPPMQREREKEREGKRESERERERESEREREGERYIERESNTTLPELFTERR